MTVFGGMHSVLFNLYLLRTGYGPDFIGIINSLGFLFHALAALATGTLVRRVPNRLKMQVGLWIVIVGRALMPLADLLPLPFRTVWVLLFFSLSTPGGALFFVSSKPYLMSVTTREERNHAFSLQGALWPITAFLGSLLGGLLPYLFAAIVGQTVADPAPFRWSLILTALLLIPAAGLIRKASDEPAHVEDRQQIPDGERPLPTIALMSVVILLTGAGSGVLRTFFTVYLDDHFHLAPYNIGLITAFGRGIGTPAALVAAVLMSRIGNRKALALSSMAIGAGVFLVFLFPSWLGAGLGYVSAMAMISLQGVVYNVFQLEVIDSAWRSTMAGVTLTTKGLGWTALSLVGGFMIMRWGYRPYFLIGAVISFLGALVFLLAFPKKSFTKVAGE
jgi:MFS family permease